MNDTERFAAVEKFVNARWPDRLARLSHKSGNTYEARLDHVETWRSDIHFVHAHADGSFSVDAE
jgi:hypothetical protein